MNVVILWLSRSLCKVISKPTYQIMKSPSNAMYVDGAFVGKMRCEYMRWLISRTVSGDNTIAIFAIESMWLLAISYQNRVLHKSHQIFVMAYFALDTTHQADYGHTKKWLIVARSGLIRLFATSVPKATPHKPDCRSTWPLYINRARKVKSVATNAVNGWWIYVAIKRTCYYTAILNYNVINAIIKPKRRSYWIAIASQNIPPKSHLHVICVGAHLKWNDH